MQKAFRPISIKWPPSWPNLDLLAEKGFKVAYENWCWATHAPTWKDVWRIVQKANRPNLGLCLDTFQSAGGEWGAPATKSGLIEDSERPELDHRWKESCKLLSESIPQRRSSSCGSQMLTE